MKNDTSIVPLERITGRIIVLRGVNVLLDSDLAALYGVETKVLIQAVKRNIDRFPKDFMFQPAAQELANLKSQIVTSSLTHGGRRKRPSVFTEQGVAMLSSVRRACLKTTRGAAARDFGCGPRRRGRHIPAAGCNDRANTGHGQKTRRPEGFRGKGRLASLLLSRRSTRDILLRRASPSGLSFENIAPWNFTTGSKNQLAASALE
jgi:hypothetical protein